MKINEYVEMYDREIMDQINSLGFIFQKSLFFFVNWEIQLLEITLHESSSSLSNKFSYRTFSIH